MRPVAICLDAVLAVTVAGLLAAVFPFGSLGQPAPPVGYDAIAIDDNLRGAGGNGAYAVGEGSTAEEAQRIALSNCTAGGNRACTLKLTYQPCGAYASSRQTAGTGTGDDMGAAIRAAALAVCGDRACRVVVADCVDVPLQPPR